jgi:dolichol kinase
MRMELEAGRRLTHASGGVFILLYIFGLIEWGHLGVLTFAGVSVAGVLEFLRLFTDVADRLSALRLVYDRLTRPYEADAPAGYFYYTLGMSGAWLLFPPFAAVPGMLMLAFGDPFSGVLSDASPNESKEAWVLVAMFGFCFFVLALPYIHTKTSLPVSETVLLSAGGAAAATVADGANVEVGDFFLDDNLTIPMVSGLAISGVAAATAAFT